MRRRDRGGQALLRTGEDCQQCSELNRTQAAIYCRRTIMTADLTTAIGCATAATLWWGPPGLQATIVAALAWVLLICEGIHLLKVAIGRYLLEHGGPLMGKTSLTRPASLSCYGLSHGWLSTAGACGLPCPCLWCGDHQEPRMNSVGCSASAGSPRRRRKRRQLSASRVRRSSSSHDMNAHIRRPLGPNHGIQQRQHLIRHLPKPRRLPHRPCRRQCRT